ncbi:MAG: hypothetical protein AAF846_25260 [Chloroflexota bacterium]
MNNSDLMRDHETLIQEIERSRPTMRAGFVDDLEAQLFDEPAPSISRVNIRRLPKMLRYSLTAAILLILTVTAFATGRIILDVLERDEGLSLANVRGLGVDLNLTQHVGDATIEVLRAHADRNRVTVALRHQDSTRPYLNSTGPDLFDADGNQLDNYVTGYSDIERNWLWQRTGVISYWSYDISEWETLPSDLDLIVRMTSFENGENQTRVNETLHEFEFTVPVNQAGFTITEPMTQTVTDIPMTLEYVSVAESGTIARICVDPPVTPADEPWEWHFATWLWVDGKIELGDQVTSRNAIDDDPNCQRILFSNGFLSNNASDEVWSLQVDSLRGTRTDIQMFDDAIRPTAEALGAEYTDYPDGGIHINNALPEIWEEIGIHIYSDAEWYFSIPVPRNE